MEKRIISAAAALGLTAVVLGAFGAHGLKSHLAPEQLSAFETGVRYQMYHALFLLFVGLLPTISDKRKRSIGYLTVFGTLLFSGSIYLLSTSKMTGIGTAVLGPITPIGGALLIAAWLVLLIGSVVKKS